MISTEMYKTRIEAPQREPRGIYAPYLDQFMQTENQSMKFNCSSVDEASKCYQAIYARNKEKNMGLVVWKKNCLVYVVKG